MGGATVSETLIRFILSLRHTEIQYFCPSPLAILHHFWLTLIFIMILHYMKNNSHDFFSFNFGAGTRSLPFYFCHINFRAGGMTYFLICVLDFYITLVIRYNWPTSPFVIFRMFGLLLPSPT